MNMFLNYNPINIEDLKREGFNINFGLNKNDYAILSKDNKWLVFEPIEDDNQLYIGDIGQWRGVGLYELLIELYNKFDINLVDEGIGFDEEIYRMQNENIESNIINQYIENSFKLTKEKIFNYGK